MAVLGLRIHRQCPSKQWLYHSIASINSTFLDHLAFSAKSRLFSGFQTSSPARFLARVPYVPFRRAPCFAELIGAMP